MTIRMKSQRIPVMDSPANPGVVSQNNAVLVSSESCKMVCVRLIATWLLFLIYWAVICSRRARVTAYLSREGAAASTQSVIYPLLASSTTLSVRVGVAGEGIVH